MTATRLLTLSTRADEASSVADEAWLERMMQSPIRRRSGVDCGRPPATATGIVGELAPDLYRIVEREDMASR